MSYWLDRNVGDKAEHLREVERQLGEQVGAEEVEPYEDLEAIWKAFRRSIARRTCGLGASPLTASDLMAIMDTYGPPREDVLERRTWFRLLGVLDDCFVDWLSKRIKH